MRLQQHRRGRLRKVSGAYVELSGDAGLLTQVHKVWLQLWVRDARSWIGQDTSWTEPD